MKGEEGKRVRGQKVNGATARAVFFPPLSPFPLFPFSPSCF